AREAATAGCAPGRRLDLSPLGGRSARPARVRGSRRLVQVDGPASALRVHRDLRVARPRRGLRSPGSRTMAAHGSGVRAEGALPPRHERLAPPRVAARPPPERVIVDSPTWKALPARGSLRELVDVGVEISGAGCRQAGGGIRGKRVNSSAPRPPVELIAGSRV